jgi:hypothetical protein
LQSLRVVTAILLALLAFVVTAANVWFAAVRSIIPLPLDAVVVAKEVRHEKHPPKDDVCLLLLEPEAAIHVDQSVFDSVHVGDRLGKEPWSRILMRNAQAVNLRWSADARGMIWAMPSALIIVMVVLATAVTRFRPERDGGPG